MLVSPVSWKQFDLTWTWPYIYIYRLKFTWDQSLTYETSLQNTVKVNKIRISIPKKHFRGKKNPKWGKETKHSQRICCEGNKKSNLHIKKLRERNFYSVFTMNVQNFFTFTVFWCDVSCKKCWSHRSHGHRLVSREPDPIGWGSNVNSILVVNMSTTKIASRDNIHSEYHALFKVNIGA